MGRGNNYDSWVRDNLTLWTDTCDSCKYIKEKEDSYECTLQGGDIKPNVLRCMSWKLKLDTI